MSKLKILVCGDVEGNFKTVFSRVNLINEKSGPFDFLFCVGNFYSSSNSLKKLEPYKNGSLTVSVPTYVLGPNQADHAAFYEDLPNHEICPNVNYLGKHGILKSNGMSVAYISGVEAGNVSNEFSFSMKEAVAVRDAAVKKCEGSQFLGVDVLISSEWPKDVTKFDKNCSLDEADKSGSAVLSWLACQLKPRYHFVGLKNVFYERPPYRNCSSLENNRCDSSHCTRFIGLAKVGNVGKNKWIYAANLTPLVELKDQLLSQSTTDETECPYSSYTEEKRGKKDVQFFYDFDTVEEIPKKRRKKSFSESEKKNFDDPETCWFCLASSSVEKHLVISIGEEVYLAMAKGGLTPYHVMIVPVRHYRAQTDLPKSATDEVKKYKSSLKKFFKTMNLVPVFYERNYKTSHLQLQVVPVPEKVAPKLKELFLANSEERDLKLCELPNKGHLRDFAQTSTPYFYLELPTKDKLFCPCSKNFPIQFGRDILASRAILNLPNKVNWRDCVQTKEKEQELTQNFRTDFERFDEISS